MSHTQRFFTVSLAALLTVVFAPHPAQAKLGDVKTWMSKVYGGDGLVATEAFLDNPQGFTADSQCNLYVADTQNYVVRKITNSDGKISTIIGSGRYAYGVGSNRVKTSFRNPVDIEIDAAGNKYVTDQLNGMITVSSATSTKLWISKLDYPQGTAITGTYLYIADTNRGKILRATLADRATPTLATKLTVVAKISKPGKMALLGGYLYVVNSNFTKLSKVNLASGIVTNVKTGLTELEGVTVYNDLVYFISGTNGTMNQFWKYNPADGQVTLVSDVPENEWYNHASDLLFCNNQLYFLFRAGSSIYKTDTDSTNPVRIAGLHRWGDLDGTRLKAILGRPTYLALSPDKAKLFLLENHKIKTYDFATKTLTFLVGHANDNYTDGIGDKARFSGVVQFAVSLRATKLYLADRYNNRIRVLDVASQTLSTLTGAGLKNMYDNQTNGYASGGPCAGTMITGAAGCAYFNRPTGIALSTDGRTLYVADSSNNRIRKVDVNTGQVSLLAGGSRGFIDGTGSRAKFRKPYTLLLSPNGKTLYVVDLGNHAIRSIDLKTKKVTTLLGIGRAGFRNGALKNAQISYPNYLAWGPNGSLMLSESGSRRVRMINLRTKTISTLAGSGQAGFVNGPGRTASFGNPSGMVMLNSSTLLVADRPNDLIRSISLK